jgi:cytochrome c-type biogenesis protein CcmE
MNDDAPRLAPVSFRRTRWVAIVALAVIGLGFVGLTASGIGENLVYYWGPTELHAAGDKAYGASIRLGGLVARDTVRRLDGGSGVEFDVIDRQGGRVHVRSRGVPPQMFRENIGVVVEGTHGRDGTFDGRRLMVSHDNEYRVPGDTADTKTLMQSTEGLKQAQ